MNACPVPGAMKRNSKLGVIEITDRCNGCGQCIPSCPYGIITVNPNTRKALKCDCCQGDPECVKHCPFNALVYVDAEKGAELRRIISTSIAGILSK
jgi:Fe-S-cluster-containing hydrogenase component 2